MTKKMKWVASLSVMIALIVSGCAQPKIAAKVNGKPIYLKDIDRQINDIKKKHSGMFDGAAGEELKKEWRKRILDTFIDEEVKYQDAVHAGIKAPEDEVNQKMGIAKQMFAKEAEYQQALRDEKITEAELRQDIIKRIMIRLVEERVGRVSEATDEEISRYYQQNLKNYVAQPEKVHLSHLLVSSRKQADQILEQIKEGADFTELARQYSTDKTSKDSGGDVGFKTKDELDKAYAKAAFSLKLGEVSQAVKAKDGYYIIKLIERQPAIYTPLEDVKTSISKQLTDGKRSKKIADWFNKLKKKAKIERFI